MTVAALTVIASWLVAAAVLTFAVANADRHRARQQAERERGGEGAGGIFHIQSLRHDRNLDHG